MAWIESHQSLGSHPKLFAFADALGIHPAQAIGHLHYLWWWAIEYATDGNVTRYVTVTDGYYTSPILLRATQYPGKEEDILTALLDCGWIDRASGDQFFIHDWDQYSNRLITMRQVNAEKQRRFRERQKAAVTGYVTVTSPLHNRTTRPDQTQPDLTKEIATESKEGNQSQEIKSENAPSMPQAMLQASPTGFSEFPSEEEVMTFAKAWPGDMARAIPAVIDESWALRHYAWAWMQEKSPKPKDWKKFMVTQWVSDCINKRGQTKGKSNGNSQQVQFVPEKRVSRNIGTANEGRESDYAELARKQRERINAQHMGAGVQVPNP